MNFIKLKQENLSKSIKFLVCLFLFLIIFCIIYVQNGLLQCWSCNNVSYISNKINYYSSSHITEEEINFSSILIQTSEIISNNSNIFFIETTCCLKREDDTYFQKIGIILNIRQACAIESTASLNRNHSIYLLYSCPINEGTFNRTSKEIIQFLRYTNVRIVQFNMTDYVKGSPVEELYTNGKLEQSLYPLEHTSDVLRFLTLWKYGGTYFDTDIICIRSIEPLGSNYAAYETENVIGSAVLNFANNGVGYNLLTKMLNHLNKHFNGAQWTTNGPDLVTNALKELCAGSKSFISKNNFTRCDEFTIYKPEIFYPISWYHWEEFFQENTTLQAVDNSYVVHLWNKLSKTKNVVIGSKQPYNLLASEYCQLTHSTLKKNKYVHF